MKWINLARRGGSQSFPNNVGIAMARGEYIAYLGHDDVWTKDHLASLNATLTEGEACDFAVGGCVYHGPPESRFQLVTGLFERDDDKFSDFFPVPSCTGAMSCAALDFGGHQIASDRLSTRSSCCVLPRRFSLSLKGVDQRP